MSLIVRRPRPYAASELIGQSPVWLLDMEYAGRTLRYSTRPVDVAHSREGTSYRYLGALPALRVDERAELLAAGDTPVAPRASVELLPGEDIAAIVERGHRLDLAYCRLAWWVPGTDYERRMVMVEGYLRGASYGGLGEPITGTIEPEPPAQDEPILNGDWTIGPDVEPSGRERIPEEDGTAYPLVIGSPGYYPSGGNLAERITQFHPAYIAPRWTRDTTATSDRSTRSILLTVGHLARYGNLRVFAKGADSGWVPSRPIYIRQINREEDALGQAITTANILSFIGSETLTEDERTATEYHVAWGDPDVEDNGAGLAENRRALRELTYSVTPTSPDADIGAVVEGDVYAYALLTVTTSFDGTDSIRLGNAANPFLVFGSSALDLSTVGTQVEIDTQVLGFDGQLRVDHQGIGTSSVGAAELTVYIEPRDTRAIETLGQLLIWAARRSRAEIDWAAWVALARELPQPIAGVVTDSSLTYWQLIADHLLPICPISLRWGPAGIRPLVWPWLGLQGLAVRDLVAGQAGVVRLPDVRYSTPSDDMVSAVRVEYMRSSLINDYAKSFVLTANPQKRDDVLLGVEWDGGSGEAEVLAQRFEGPRVDTIESDWIYHRETAAWVARWRLALLGVGYRLVEIEGAADLGSLDLGDVVTFTDSTLHLTSAPAIVVGRSITDAGRVGLSLAMRSEQTSVSTGPNPDGGPHRPDGSNPVGN